MTDLLALADRVERGQPSRELDALVDAAVKYQSPEWRIVTTGDSGTYRAFKGEDAFIIDECRERYTSSLDAAVTLVPDGYSWEVRRSGYGDPAQACVWNPRRAPGKGNDIRVTHGDGCAPAALTAACLRARASLAKVVTNG